MSSSKNQIYLNKYSNVENNNKFKKYNNSNRDDRRYSCECIVVVKDINKLIHQLEIPTDVNHRHVYILKSEFIKKYIKEMRYSHQNKFLMCDFLIEINYNSNKKIVNKYENIQIEVTYNCPNDDVISYIPDNTYVLCASFGKITTRPRVQFGMTEGSKTNELQYRDKKFVYKPLNFAWKFKTGNRGVLEEFGLNKKLYWKCINEQLYKWGKYKWVATLVTII